MGNVEVRLSTQEQKSREKIMQKLERIVDTEEVESLIMKSINEENSVQTLIREYENRLNDSFDRLYQELKHIYGQADEQDSRLSNAIMDFSQQHDNAYFEMGIMLGVKLYKNFSHKPNVCFKDSIENILQYGYNYRMTEENKKLLTTLFLERADRIIENVCFLQALFGEKCKIFLENVASPNWRKLQGLGWQLFCQLHSHCRPYLVVIA